MTLVLVPIFYFSGSWEGTSTFSVRGASLYPWGSLHFISPCSSACAVLCSGMPFKHYLGMPSPFSLLRYFLSFTVAVLLVSGAHHFILGTFLGDDQSVHIPRRLLSFRGRVARVLSRWVVFMLYSHSGRTCFLNLGLCEVWLRLVCGFIFIFRPCYFWLPPLARICVEFGCLLVVQFFVLRG